jgi:NADH pyrophosphatase NudC (nudix superfamily)
MIENKRSLSNGRFLFYNQPMQNYFSASDKSPYHLSIGAVVINNENKLLIHHFKEISGYADLYILMRESLELNETIEQALARGLQEEFGISGTIIDSLGTLVSHFPKNDQMIEKTTLYFLVKYDKEHPEGRIKNDAEGASTLLWKTPDELIALMEAQSQHWPEQTDLNEAEIVQRTVKYLT